MMKTFYCSVSAILGGICVFFILLPLSVFAQSRRSEIYWLYYTPDSTAYVEREFQWGGYQDHYYYSDNNRSLQEQMPAEKREKYRKECLEYAKTLVFYTKKDLEKEPVRLKPGDTFNLSRRKKD